MKSGAVSLRPSFHGTEIVSPKNDIGLSIIIYEKMELPVAKKLPTKWTDGTCIIAKINGWSDVSTLAKSYTQAVGCTLKPRPTYNHCMNNNNITALALHAVSVKHSKVQL